MLVIQSLVTRASAQEWLPSVPLHIQLYHALNLTPPTYKHLPLLLSQAGAKLSKRVGDVGIEWFRDRGYDPSALLIFAGNQGRSGRRAESVEELYEQVSGTIIHTLTINSLIFSR